MSGTYFSISTRSSIYLRCGLTARLARRIEAVLTGIPAGEHLCAHRRFIINK